MKNIKIISAIMLCIVSSRVFAGELQCDYNGTITTLAYSSTDNSKPTMVAPNISAYTQSCDGVVCDVVFLSFGEEPVVYTFNKAETLTYQSVDGVEVECTDSRTDKIKTEVDRVENQVERALQEAEDDVQNIGRKVDKALRSIFD